MQKNDTTEAYSPTVTTGPQREPAAPVTLNSQDSKTYKAQFSAGPSCLPPVQGTGVHLWVASESAKLIVRGVKEEAAVSILMPFVVESRGSRAIAEREVRSAVCSAARKFTAGQRHGHGLNTTFCRHRPPVRTHIPTVSATPLNWEAIEQHAVTSDVTTADLFDCSPVRFEARRPDYWLQILWRPGELICCSTQGPQLAKTRPREEWEKNPFGLELCVPSPMSCATGVNQEGKRSARCLSNTGPRRWLVVEFDFKAGNGKQDGRMRRLLSEMEKRNRTSQDACAALLLHLATRAPLGLVVSSGGKSLHGWFSTLGVPEEKVERFMRYAVSIGADPATWCRCQMVRFPDGRRSEGGKAQYVLFCNPAAMGESQ